MSAVLSLIIGFSSPVSAKNCLDNTSNSKVTYCNWPKEWKNYRKYDVVTINSGDISVAFSKNLEAGRWSQGAAYGEKYMVYSSHSNTEEEKGGYQYIYVENIATGKRVQLKSKDWGHIHGIYYGFKNNRFYVKGSFNTEKDSACYQINEDNSNTGFSVKKITPLSKCGVDKPSTSYGKTGLVYQSESYDQSSKAYSGYTFVAFWDPGTFKNSSGKDYYKYAGQRYHYTKNSNVITINDKSGKVVKAIYIPQSVIDGELEAVSTDREGNLYATFGVGARKQNPMSVTYKINYNTFKPKEDSTESAPSEKEIEGGEIKEKTTGSGGKSSDNSTAIADSVCNDPDSLEVTKQLAKCSKTNSSSDLMNSITAIIQTIMSVLGIVAVIAIIIGGIGFATSAGDPTKRERSKSIVLYAIIGLLVSLLAYAIVSFVITSTS